MLLNHKHLVREQDSYTDRDWDVMRDAMTSQLHVLAFYTSCACHPEECDSDRERVIAISANGITTWDAPPGWRPVLDELYMGDAATPNEWNWVCSDSCERLYFEHALALEAHKSVRPSVVQSKNDQPAGGE
jgi:hypothetical protein